MGQKPRIPDTLYGHLLAAHQAGATCKQLAAWLASEHKVKVSGEAVRLLLRALQSGAKVVKAEAVEAADPEPDPLAVDPADPAAKLQMLDRLAAQEVKRARRSSRNDPRDWRRYHSALGLALRVAQARQPKGAAAPEPDTSGATSEVFALPAFSVSQKPEA